jgi:hypothetical protein
MTIPTRVYRDTENILTLSWLLGVQLLIKLNP